MALKIVTKRTKIVIGMAFGVEFIHKTGCMQRILKLESLFLNGSFEPVIGERSNKGGRHSTSYGTRIVRRWGLWTACWYVRFAISMYKMFKLLPPKLLQAKSQIQLQKHYRKGFRFPQIELLNDAYWNLITRAWDQVPPKRPTFSQILNEMCKNVSKFLFEGGDENEFRRYISILR
jgi:hypothetical protein